MKNQTIPEGLDVLTTLSGITIRRTWLTWKIAPLAIFAIAWDSFLIFWYSMAMKSPNTPWIMIVFPIGHLAVGFGITYYVIASLFNKTDICITSSYIESKTAPIPWIGNKKIPVQEITGIIVRERSGNRGSITYSVMYVDRNRREKKFISWLSAKDQADYISNNITDILGIKDEAA
jgi:hypothetical protein